MTQSGRTRERPLTVKEQEQLLTAVEEAKKFQAEMLARRKGRLYPAASIAIGRSREQRTRDLDIGKKDRRIAR
jgi:hypothetical protein